MQALLITAKEPVPLKQILQWMNIDSTNTNDVRRIEDMLHPYDISPDASEDLLFDIWMAPTLRVLEKEVMEGMLTAEQAAIVREETEQITRERVSAYLQEHTALYWIAPDQQETVRQRLALDMKTVHAYIAMSALAKVRRNRP